MVKVLLYNLSNFDKQDIEDVLKKSVSIRWVQSHLIKVLNI